MKNLYNKGPFRNHEYGKLTPYQKKCGNRKWRRTITSEIEDQLLELVKFRKTRIEKRKLIWIKVTKEISGKKLSNYKSFYTEKQFRRTVNDPHIIRYSIIKNKFKTNEHLH
ncbi:hypothetical protein MUU74_01620 [Chryseobacterium daecheongense]|uniref:hypothetical protein n=1 Tax=Chryseobacterium daecheongense TaxID=192389 RepID=UPI001FD71A91|nr:hypothetical protein [Chryseobacterium daecheongense]UOU98666.1 hypothetical protein MUU74_01620 [Chryseobacterium daecheongense]